MSATAFQRLRREAEAKRLAEKELTDFNKMTNEKLRDLLNERGIEFDSKAKKDELVKLLEGAE